MQVAKKRSNAAGPNDIPHKMLKYCAENIAIRKIVEYCETRNVKAQFNSRISQKCQNCKIK